jgi:high-affinity nickel-transport protein
MTNVLAIIVVGFFLGMRHATDPDHVIAITTIVARCRKLGYALLIGAFWGVGHTLTVLLVGSGIILFGWVIPAHVGLSMELCVGLMLILLGVFNLTGVLQWMTNKSTPHGHGDHAHAHPFGIDAPVGEDEPAGWFARHCGRLGFYQIVRPLVVGLVHGLAGSAAVALLVMTTIRDPKWAVVYLLVFGAGAIAGMMLITSAMVLPFAYAPARFGGINRGLRIASGVISVAFGVFMVCEIGFVNGLFTNHPVWTPL